ncbi:hypothetical protein Tco_0967355, partial [Tanacetum coccineum]
WLITLEEQEDEDEEELTTRSGMNLQLGNESPVQLDNHHFSPSDSEATNQLRSPISSSTLKIGPQNKDHRLHHHLTLNTRGFIRLFSTKRSES